MEQERRTRQSNREYQQRVRRESTRTGREQQEFFRVIPGGSGNSSGNSRTNTSAGAEGQSRRSSGQGRSGSGQGRKSSTSGRKRTAQGRRSSAAGKKRPATSQKRPASAQGRGLYQGRPDSAQGRTTAGQRTVKNGSLRRAKAAPMVYFDYTLVFIVVFLVLFGLLMLYTASVFSTEKFIKQFVIAIGGMVVMYVVSRIDYHVYARKEVLITVMVGALIAVLLLFTSLGISKNGSTRWIGFGFLSIQPAEIWKIGIILLDAALINRFSKRMRRREIIGLFGFITVFSFLVILGPADNLSSAIIVAMITVLMVFVAYPTYKPFLVIGGIGVALAGAFIYASLNVDGFAEFRGERIIAWLQPEKIADQSKTFQSLQALYSIGSGGLTGKGLGNGIQKLILPEAINDMIFAIICEEMGLIGAFIVLVMFAVLLYRLMFIAKNSKDLLGGMLATGVFAHFMLQIVLNIGVVTGLLPSTGVTLPFISSGGTALVLLMVEVGITLNISRQIDFEQRLVRRPVKKRIQ